MSVLDPLSCPGHWNSATRQAEDIKSHRQAIWKP
jgi:hypothetical protein